jgi:hypothetical protein
MVAQALTRASQSVNWRGTYYFMGSFYVNYTVRHSKPQTVAKALKGRTALVTPAQNGCVVVYDEESDQQDWSVITDLGSQLSGELKCPVLAVLNHDDDLLRYGLFVNGDMVDEYDSAPEDFDGSEEDAEPLGGDARELCTAFGSDAAERVEEILRKGPEDEDHYVFATVRHHDLVNALGLPEFSVGAGYEHISEGNLPEGLDEEGLINCE